MSKPHRLDVVGLRLTAVEVAILGKLGEQTAERCLVGTCLAPLMIGASGCLGIADDDAVIILESGNEKLRYVVGSAVVITNTDYEYMEISTLAAEMAAKLLNNSQWKTKISY